MRFSFPRLSLVSVVLLWLFVALPAGAVFNEEQLKDPTLEAKAQDIAKGIRCLVCQNESIMDSGADLAKDLRGIVREQVAAGKSEAEIKQFLVSRYGDWVLLNPPFKAQTFILWASPAFVFLIGGYFMFLFLRRKNDKNAELSSGVSEPLTEEEQAELNKVLNGSDRPGGTA